MSGCQVEVILPVHSAISQKLFAFHGIRHFELRIALISPADTTLTEPQNSPLQIALILLATATDFTGFPRFVHLIASNRDIFVNLRYLSLSLSLSLREPHSVTNAVRCNLFIYLMVYIFVNNWTLERKCRKNCNPRFVTVNID